MKHSLTIALLSLLLVACGSGGGDELRLKGHFEHLQQTQLYVYSTAGSFSRVDTIQVVRGDFTYTCRLKEPTVLSIVYPNFGETLLVGAPGETLRYKADVSNLRHAQIKGSAANDSLSAFRLRWAAESLPRQRKAAADYISRHPADMASLALFQRYFEQAEVITKAPTAKLLVAIVKAQPKLESVRELRDRLTPLLTTAVGACAPKLLPQAGHPALLIFTLNSQMLSGQLRAMAQRHTEGTDVVFQEICADNCDFDSLRLRYGLRYLPGSLLMDAQGTIVARDINPMKLESELKRFKQK